MKDATTTTHSTATTVRSETLGFEGRFIPSDDPQLLIAEAVVQPGGNAGPLHRHLHQSERFDVESGAITVRLGRTRHVVSAGEAFTVPPGAPHTFNNHTAHEARFRSTFSPPLRLQEFFVDLLSVEGKPTLKRSARLMREYPDEFFYLARVPVRLQRALGRLAR